MEEAAGLGLGRSPPLGDALALAALALAAARQRRMTPRAQLAALGLQAAWLRKHPEVVVRIEGYGDALDTRDHALAVGARRAEEARSYLLLLGVPAAQVSTTSWGKERPGLGRAVTILVR